MIDDLSKYKRLFTFGCSFTKHLYPTWANILSVEMPHAEFCNLANPGAGNSYIAWRIAEANNRFKFNKDDLIVVMYSTFCREDRYIDGKWQLYGNVFNNNFYDKGFLKYAEPDGYAIQNLATIELSMGYLKLLSCDSIFLNSMPFNNAEFNGVIYSKDVLEKLKQTYPHIFNMPVSFFEYLHPDLTKSNQFHEKGISYTNPQGNWFGDAHPTPYWGFKYLEYLKFPMTDLSLNWAIEQTSKAKDLGTFDSINDYFQYLYTEAAYKTKDMF